MTLALLATALLIQGLPVQDDSTRHVSSPLLIITSTPDSAEVFVDSTFAGTTPCSTHVSPGIPYALLVLQSPAGAWLTDAVRDTVMAAYGDTVRRHFDFRPLPLTLTSSAGTPSGAIDITGASLLYPPRWRLYLSGGGALLAGAAAAYFKGRADDAHAEFQATGNPAAGASRDRYDRTSTVFLIAAEVSFGLFLAFLLSE